MSKNNFILLLCILFAVSLPSLTALSLNGPKLSPIIFEPGRTLTNHYAITDTNKQVEVRVGGDLEEYIRITEVINNEFDLIISFPDYLTPGTYHFDLTAEEVAASESGGIGTLLSVSKRFIVEVYTYDKYVEISLSAPSVNEGTPVHFQFSVTSKGYKDINFIQGRITVFDDHNNTLGTVTTEEKPLKALGSETLTADFNTEGLLADEYRADGIVFYDGQQKTAATVFRIGQMDLLLLNHTIEVEEGFSEYTMEVLNNWGNELRNVYAKLFVEGEEVLQTPSINLEPWQQGTVGGIINLEKNPGPYPALIKLFFEGETREESFTITVIEKASAEELHAKLERSNRNLAVLASVIVLLTSSIVLLMVLFKRKEKRWKWRKNDEFEK